jgi:hypothetical protein
MDVPAVASRVGEPRVVGFSEEIDTSKADAENLLILALEYGMEETLSIGVRALVMYSSRQILAPGAASSADQLCVGSG